MNWLNYHHLHYFWQVVRAGSVTEASRRLGVAQPTVSAQLRSFEKAVGRSLFRRQGRRLVPTSTGRLIAEYADDIFKVGNELMAAVEKEDVRRPTTLLIGVADVVPKIVTSLLLEVGLESQDPPCRMRISEGKSEELLAELALHRLDLVVSDRPIGRELGVRAYNHALGESPCGFFATAELAERSQGSLAERLETLPLLLPTDASRVRFELDAWLAREAPEAEIVAECDDAALMKVFAQRGHGVFPAPMAIADEVVRKHDLVCLGVVSEIRHAYYGISLERRITHPVIRRIRDLSRERLIPGSEDSSRA